MKIKVILLVAALAVTALFGGCSGSNGTTASSAVSADTSTVVSQGDTSSADTESTAEGVESAEGQESTKSTESTESTEDTDSRTEVSEGEESDQPTGVSEDTPAGEAVAAAWFDDALFIGDSVTLKLSYYADTGAVGEAAFLCAGSLGYNNCLWDIDREDNVHPVYEGVKYTIFDGAEMLQPKKMFVMLGMNDIGLYGVDGAAEAMEEVVDKLKERCPDTVIYIESVTPMLENMQLTDLNNTTIAQFNEKAKVIAEEKGCRWLNVASAMEDGSGNLVYEYCGDPDAMGLHFSDTGCGVWVDYLKTHVQ